jgi:hypothetical protein
MLAVNAKPNEDSNRDPLGVELFGLVDLPPAR